MIQQSRRTFASVILTLVLVPALTFAQGVSVSFTNGRSNATTGLDQVSGVHATLAKPLGTQPWSVRFGAGFLAGSRSDTGVLWSDIIPPTPPTPEQINKQRNLIMMSAGIGHFAFRNRAVMMHTYADVTGGFARGTDKSAASGDSREASKFTGGVRGGIEAQWAPSKTTPFSLQVGTALEGIKPLSLTECADCWMPFVEGFDLARFYLGIVIGRQTFRR